MGPSLLGEPIKSAHVARAPLFVLKPLLAAEAHCTWAAQPVMGTARPSPRTSPMPWNPGRVSPRTPRSLTTPRTAASRWSRSCAGACSRASPTRTATTSSRRSLSACPRTARASCLRRALRTCRLIACRAWHAGREGPCTRASASTSDLRHIAQPSSLERASACRRLPLHFWCWSKRASGAAQTALSVVQH
jgi:hypothetical protein